MDSRERLRERLEEELREYFKEYRPDDFGIDCGVISRRILALLASPPVSEAVAWRVDLPTRTGWYKGTVYYRRDIADEFGVSENAVGDLIRGITWKHVSEHTGEQT